RGHEALRGRPQLVTHATERGLEGGAPDTEIELGGPAALDEQALLGALEGQPLVVEQGLDAQDQIEVAPPIETLTGRVLLRTKQTKLRLPVAEDVGGYLGGGLDLADPVVELVRDRHPTLSLSALRRTAAAHASGLTTAG